MPAYKGWDVVSMPSDPPAPANLELRHRQIAGLVKNPFTGEQQTQDWDAEYMEASVSYPSMTHDQAPAWKTFMKALRGVNAVFQFSSALCTDFPELAGGSPLAPRYWRLMPDSPAKWEWRPGPFFSLTFEIMEAL